MKKKSILILLIVSVLLVVSNIFVEHLGSSQNKPVPMQLSVSEIEKKFFQVLYDYGIKKDWISVEDYKNSKEDSLTTQLYVKIPKTVKMPFLISSIKSEFRYSPVDIVSEELEIHGDTNLEIFSGEDKKLRALLRYNREVYRKSVSLAFIVSDFPELNDAQKDKLFNLVYPYAVMLYPGKEAVNLTGTLTNLGKEYTLLLNDKIEDREYALTGKLNKSRIKDTIIKIVNNFSDAASVFVDHSSNLYNSVSYSYIRNQFGQKGVALKPLTMLNEMGGKNEKDLESLVKFYVESMNNGEHRLFKIELSNFIKLKDELKKYKQKGHKIIFPSLILN